MRTSLDFSPLFRSSIGFDRVFTLLESVSRTQGGDNWPPYNILKTGPDSYRITMAVAGFTPEELSVTHEPNMLVVSGAKAESEPEDVAYLHRGIAERAFQRRFELADHVEVTSARLENGLLTIELVRELPEEMKPRRIEIRAGEVLPPAQPQPATEDRQAA
ncbi:MAG: Hsp20 family protein [Rhodospirillaceae bacterium]|nr:Hsp20 family protein [Rhodospirillaceae bacterium]